ncbi:MAG: inositol monophosphatase family protein [Elusimicrobiota bacterium]
MENISELYFITKKALLLAGNEVRKSFYKNKKVTFKDSTSPVTEVDVRCERIIIATIKKKFPQHTFLAEESAFIKKGDLGPAKGDRYRWVIDPIDGTVNFIHQIPQVCVSIAVESNGVTLVGGVFDPIKNELFMAVKGKGATLNGKKIVVSKKSDFKKSLLITGFPYDRDKHAKKLCQYQFNVLKKGIDIRRFGSAALDLCWLAAGRAEGFWEINLQPWDVAAGVLILSEAGGRTTDFKGNPFHLDRTTETLATNGKIHRQMIETLNT